MAAICTSVRDHLEAFVDGEVPEPLATQLRAHLAGCDACRDHHAEASSLPVRLAALRTPESPAALVGNVISRVSRYRISPLGVWGPLAVELVLALVALWYLSGLGGFTVFLQRTAADAGAFVGWYVGQSALPAPPPGDVFLLLVCCLLLVTTLFHLTLLSRQGQRLS